MKKATCITCCRIEILVLFFFVFILAAAAASALLGGFFKNNGAVYLEVAVVYIDFYGLGLRQKRSFDCKGDVVNDENLVVWL